MVGLLYQFGLKIELSGSWKSDFEFLISKNKLSQMGIYEKIYRMDFLLRNAIHSAGLQFPNQFNARNKNKNVSNSRCATAQRAEILDFDLKIFCSWVCKINLHAILLL